MEPPAKRSNVPEPVDTAAEVVKDKAARSAAVAAAALAAAQAAPGQRDRAVERAAQAALEAAAATRAKDASSATERSQDVPPPMTSYQLPDWAGVPDGVDYSIEILKNGSIVETRQLKGKDHFTFGRNPVSDFVLEHPSSSRLHAVLQFKAHTGDMYLYDNSSTHGTWLNKQKIKPGVYVPTRVGDTIRFGTSSRLMVLCGPDDLQPPERLTPSAKRQLALLEATARAKEKDLAASKAAMDAAISGDVTWGMGGPDAEEDPEDDAGDIDWRPLSAAGKLTEKQQKLADKIRQKEYKIKNLETEVERIMAKEKQEGGLTPGQAATLARNQQAIDKFREEVEELEESLQDSIKESRAAKNKDAAAKSEAAAAKRKRGTTASDDEYLEGSDSDDDFYDRTAAGFSGSRKKGKANNGSAAGSGKAGQAVQQVESAQSLYGKREVLTSERQELLAAIAEEEQRVNASKSADGQAPQEPGDKQATQQQQQTASDKAAEQPVSTEAAPAAVDADSLDAFMTNMEQQLETDKLKSMRTKLASIDAQLARTEKLLRIADPDGWLRPDSKSVQAAKVAAQQVLEAEKRREAAAAVAAKKQAAEQSHFVEEVEEDDTKDTPTTQPSETNVGPTPGSPTQTSKPVSVIAPRPLVLKPNLPAVARLPTSPQKQKAGNLASNKLISNTHAAAQAAKLIEEFSGRATQHELAGDAANRILPSVKRDRSGSTKEAGGSDVLAKSKAEARVAEDLEALNAAERRRKELQELEEQEREEAAAAAALAAQRAKQQEELQRKLGY